MWGHVNRSTNTLTKMKRSVKYLKITATILLFIVTFSLFAIANLWLIPSLQYSFYQSKFKRDHTKEVTSVSDDDLKKLQQKLNSLNKKLDKLTPGNVFLVVSTSENTFALHKNNEVIRRGICSTGSFVELEVDSTKSYTFETPKGVLTVKGKITNPVWHKPDWAFIEDGLPVPPVNHYTRYERNVLGDYALSLGNGYLIHGTLYQRFLGQPVTHGCVRLGDEDLEVIYNTMPIGAKVFIY